MQGSGFRGQGLGFRVRHPGVWCGFHHDGSLPRSSQNNQVYLNIASSCREGGVYVYVSVKYTIRWRNRSIIGTGRRKLLSVNTPGSGEEG